MILLKAIQVELPVFTVCRGSRLRFIGFFFVGRLYPNPGSLLAVAVKPMLWTWDPSLDGIVHDVIDLTDVLPIRFAQHVIALIEEQLRADIIAPEAIQESLDHAGTGIFGHKVHPEDSEPVLHLRRERQ